MGASGEAGESQIPPGERTRDLAAVELALNQERRNLLSYLEKHLPAELRPAIEPGDVLQDTYFEAFRRLSDFRIEGQDAAYRWLVTIARNRVIDLVRRKRALKRRGESGDARNVLQDGGLGQDSVVAMLQDLAVYRRTPSRSAMRHELVAALERAMEQLPVTYRDTIRLRYLEGLPVEEAARRMGRTAGSVKQLSLRAQQALRLAMRSASIYL